MWFELKGDVRLGRCSTEGCGGQPTWRLEAGGVGSNYCSGCKSTMSEPAGWMEDQDRMHPHGAASIGPWEWVVHDGSMATLAVEGDGIVGHVMSVSPCKSCQKDDWQWGTCSVPSIENARLIAAAPKMLEAILATRALVSEAAMTGFNCRDGDWTERLFANQARLSAAIDEATGKKYVTARDCPTET